MPQTTMRVELLRKNGAGAREKGGIKMTTREKLIDLLTHGIPTGDHRDIIATSKRVAGIIADHLISNGVTFATDANDGGKWIPVEERLPELGSRVIASGEKGGVFLVKSGGVETGWGRMDGGSKVRSFTHWMPLPQPPKGDEP